MSFLEVCVHAVSLVVTIMHIMVTASLPGRGDRGKIGLGARPETYPCHLQFISLWAKSLISMHQITSLNLPNHSKKQVWLIPFYRLSKLRFRETK